MNKSSRSFPVYAIADKTVTWMMRILALIGLVVLFLLGLLLPIAFVVDDGYRVSYSRNPVNSVILIALYELCFFFLCRWLVKYWKRNQDKTIVKMWIDEKGLHRQQKDGNILSILYSQLRSVPKEGRYDVYTQQTGSGKYSRTALLVNYRDETGIVKPVEAEFTMNIWYAFYPANTMEMRAAFFQNIAGYKEIRINPEVYRHYHINPVTFQFDAKKYWIQWILILLFIISVLLIILLLTKE
ncbi:hypothetical protein [Chryseobacterium vaccae]|uniref:hypothetical protein n=1 Tax=Chryseobacterium vaccae TaxID=2604424 RepID=UPI001295A8DE|nr:hypothetical protein [Chryseobacterium vaccae]